MKMSMDAAVAETRREKQEEMDAAVSKAREVGQRAMEEALREAREADGSELAAAIAASLLPRSVSNSACSR